MARENYGNERIHRARCRMAERCRRPAHHCRRRYGDPALAWPSTGIGWICIAALNRTAALTSCADGRRRCPAGRSCSRATWTGISRRRDSQKTESQNAMDRFTGCSASTGVLGASGRPTTWFLWSTIATLQRTSLKRGYELLRTATLGR